MANKTKAIKEVKGKEVKSKKAAAVPAAKEPAAKAKLESSDEESSEESSESEVEIPKTNGKTPIATKTAKAGSDSDESSDESSSEEDVTVQKANGKVSKAKSPSSDSDSDSEDSGKEKPKATQIKTPTKDAGKKGSSDSSESSDSSDDEVPKDTAPGKASVTKSPVSKKSTAAKQAQEAKSSSSSDNDSSGESSDESESGEKNEDVKMDGPVSTAAVKNGKRKADQIAEVPTKKAKLTTGETATTAESQGESKTCFIGRLSWNVDNDWLASEFAECGEVISARVQMDRNTGKSRGFGFVEFATMDGANAAVALNGTKEIDGRVVNVDKTSPKPADPEKRAKAFGDVPSEPSTVLFVGNVSFDTTEDGLWEVFAEYGEVKSVRLPTDRETQRPKGFGYVEFVDIESAKKAFDGAKGLEIGGRSLRLDFSQPRTEGGGGGGGGGFKRGRGGFGGGDRGGDRGWGGRGGGDRGGRGGRDGGRGGGRGGRGGRGAPRGGARGGPRTGGAVEFRGERMTF
ncbi:hypothetical protein M0805_007894 [Coniferiporia weirii]|nr:hypothetical protein M0805_007894 [Coniferiporia weirii]